MERRYTIIEAEPGEYFIDTKFGPNDVIQSRKGNWFIIVSSLRSAIYNGWNGWIYKIRPASDDEIRIGSPSQHLYL